MNDQSDLQLMGQASYSNIPSVKSPMYPKEPHSNDSGIKPNAAVGRRLRMKDLESYT